jgi:hypothetical protein
MFTLKISFRPMAAFGFSQSILNVILMDPTCIEVTAYMSIWCIRRDVRKKQKK